MTTIGRVSADGLLCAARRSNVMKSHPSHQVIAALGGVLCVVVSGCGGITQQGADSGAAAGCKTDTVLEQVKDMPAQDRTAKLQELAKQEGAGISMYGDLGRDELDGVLNAFKQKFGIGVETYSATSEEVLQRLGSESQADQVQGDLLQNNGTELTQAGDKGLLAKVTSPYAADLPPEVVFPTWVGTQYNIFTVLRNNSVIPDADAPRTYQDLADPKYDGKIGIEAGNFDLFATIVKYLQDHDGMSEDQAIDLWRKIADGAMVYTSNTPLADAVNQGELGLAITYNHYYSRLHARGGSNLQWQPAIQPQVLRPNGVGIPCRAPHPATALLLFDFFISEDGQRALAEKVNRDVTNPNVKAGLLYGTDLERVYVDLEDVITQSDRWRTQYDEITRDAQAG
jgi:iron(III) transport system substrate-binding protein